MTQTYLVKQEEYSTVHIESGGPGIVQIWQSGECVDVELAKLHEFIGALLRVAHDDEDSSRAA